MRIGFALPVVIAATLFAAPTVHGQTTLYIVSRESSQIRTFTLPSGPVTTSKTIVTTPPGPVLGCFGLAAQPGTNLLWTIIVDQNLILRLASMDIAAATATTVPATIVGPLSGHFAGLAFNCTGELFGVTATNAFARAAPKGDSPAFVPDKSLYRGLIAAAQGGTDPTLVTTVASVDDGASLALHPSGVLYWFAGRGTPVFMRVQVSPLVIDEIPLSGSAFTEASALTFLQSSGQFYMAGLFEMYRLTIDGVVSPLATSDMFPVSGLAVLGQSCGAADVPDEPAGSRPALLEVESPFSASSTIRFRIDRPTAVTIQAFDVSGRMVRTLLARSAESPGSHELRWDGRDDRGRMLPAGVYLIRAATAEESATRRVIKLQ